MPKNSLKMKRNKKILTNLAGLLFVFLVMAAAAIMRDGHLLGHDLTRDSEKASVRTVNPDGSITVNTTTLADDVSGYSGPVPVEITIAHDTVTAIRPLDNSETPGFFSRVTESGIMDRWTGKTVREALDEDVDAVTGATYSSTALIANVKAGLQSYVDAPVTHDTASKTGMAVYISLLVVAMAAIIPLFVKNKNYRLIQEILNVGVLGFWTGTFVDYTAMLGIMSYGLGASASITVIAMLVVAFIWPLFGHPGHYCAWVCPLGSLQELASRCNSRRKINLSPKAVKILTRFRLILWAVLMILLWTGMFASWIDYELFTAFMVREAATATLIAGAAFLLLSFFITRPYCRFVCPTGTLLRMSQDIDTK